MKTELTLMFVTDDSIKEEDAFFNILEAALKGGATCIQLREKSCTTLTFYQRALKAKRLCHAYNVPLIINDRIDIALAIDADGVHIGQKDMPYTIARKLLGKHKIIGLSVSNPQQAIDANKEQNLNYIGLSPVFATTTKTTNLALPLGIDGLKTIQKISTKPIVCIGGIHHGNAAELIKNGAHGIAVITAISTADNPEKETRKLKETLC